MIAGSIESYLAQSPSELILEALEDTELPAFLKFVHRENSLPSKTAIVIMMLILTV